MCISDAIQTQKDFYFVEFKVIPDQDYIRSRSEKIAFDETLLEESFICFGSPYSNYLTERIYDMTHPFAHDKNLYHFDGADYLVSNKALEHHSKDVRHKDPLKFKANNDVDYAIISRITSRKKTFFICAGVRFPGTRLSMNYLFDNWHELHGKTAGMDFFRIFEIDTNDSSIRPLGPLMVRSMDSDAYTPT